MSSKSIDVKSVTRQMDYQIWELVPLKFISKVHHEANAKKIKNFFRSSTSPASTHTLASHCHQPQYQGKIDEIVTISAVSEAEIQWTLKSVIAGYSNNSNPDCSRLFSSMFPDSKLWYSVNFGIDPYFKNILMDSIRKSAHFVISFDVSLNKVTQLSELDFYCDILICWK